MVEPRVRNSATRIPTLLIFDEATSNLDTQTAEQLAQTINKLKGEATIVFITHAVPRGLAVDEALRFGPRPTATPSPSQGDSVAKQIE